jgi:Cellulase (glycosyl hydrolase family 5)
LPARSRRLRVALAVAAAAAAAAVALVLLTGDGDSPPGSEPQVPGPEVSIMDDQLLIGASREEVESSMRSFEFLGADRVRVSAFWRDLAPAPRSLRRPASVRYDWRSLDRVVRAAAAHGLRVMITIATPAPLWATEQPSRRNPLWRPRPREFGAFAAAVASRYAEQVDQYGVLNEPNQGGWLQPQSERGRLVSPHVYRQLVYAAYPAIRRADPSAAVLVGELAPSGRDDRGATRPIRPLEFLRELACVDERLSPRDDGPCRGFRPVPLDALGHHPYQLLAPDAVSADPDDAGMGDTRRLLATLDRLVAARRLRPRTAGPPPVHYTEFGYQTDPPDPFAGVPLSRQDSWLQEAAYVAWRFRARVRTLNQFRVTDGALTTAAGNTRFREFQSGLYFADFKPKPAARSFPHPFVVVRRGSGRTGFFGQVRRGSAREVRLERAPRRGEPFERVEEVTTDDRGYFFVELEAEPGVYRYSYASGGRTERSRAATVR